MKAPTLSPEELRKIDAYWRAANYLAVGQIYLYDTPLLKRPLAFEALARTPSQVIRSTRNEMTLSLHRVDIFFPQWEDDGPQGTRHRARSPSSTSSAGPAW